MLGLRGATVALTPVQKVARSDHVGVKVILETYLQLKR